MKHTMLFQEGSWEASGIFIDEHGSADRVTGHTVIQHGQDLWVNDGTMRIEKKTPTEFRNRYEIQPFKDGSDVTLWSSDNPALGRLEGRFVVVEDTILSIYESVDGQYNGTEHLIKIGDDHYHSRGALFCVDQKLSSWSVELKRIEVLL